MRTAPDGDGRPPSSPGAPRPTPALAPYPPIVAPSAYPFAASPRRLRGPLELVVALLAWAVLGVLAYGVAYGVAQAAGVRETAVGFAQPHLDLGFSLLAIVAVLPALALAVRLVGGRRLGSVSSVAGRLRWAWMRRCLWPAAACTALVLVAALALDPTFDRSQAPSVAGYLGFAVLVLALVPLQAAAEEYLARGWALQVLVPWLRRPWLAVLPGAALFVALHGSADPERVLDLAVFALVLSWLTIRTGGLEAAVAFHVAFNLIFFLVSGIEALPDLAEDDQALTLAEAAATAVPTVLYAAWIDRRWRREVPPEPVGHSREAHRPPEPEVRAAGRMPAVP